MKSSLTLIGSLLPRGRAVPLVTQVDQVQRFFWTTLVQDISLRSFLMKFISRWSLPQGSFDAAVERFLKTGGAPPKGVKMLGRWHGMDGTGFAVSETTDAKAMYLWVSQWADVLDFDRHALRRGRRGAWLKRRTGISSGGKLGA
jgi:hypothetical protein